MRDQDDHATHERRDVHQHDLPSRDDPGPIARKVHGAVRPCDHPSEQPDAARSLIEELVREHQTTATAGRAERLGRPEQMVERVWRALAEYGPLTGLLARGDVEEVFIEGDRVSYIEVGGRLAALNEPTSEKENRHIVERLLEGTGRRLDATSAIQQAHVLDGRGRLTAVIEPVSKRLSATLRMYTANNETLGSLVRSGLWSPAAAAFLSDQAEMVGTAVAPSEPSSAEASTTRSLPPAFAR